MSDTKYIYVREEVCKKAMDKYYEDLQSLPTPQVGPKPRGFPIGCFAYRIIPVLKNGKVVGQTCQYGYSVFNPNDTFDKRTARVTAEYRMLLDCRAAYSTPNWHPNDLIAQVLRDTANTEIHQWALAEDGGRQPLSLRFRKACARMAEHIDSLPKSETRKVA